MIERILKILNTVGPPRCHSLTHQNTWDGGSNVLLWGFLVCVFERGQNSYMYCNCSYVFTSYSNPERIKTECFSHMLETSKIFCIKGWVKRKNKDRDIKQQEIRVQVLT